MYNSDEPPLSEDKPPSQISFAENIGKSDEFIRVAGRNIRSHFFLHRGLPKHNFSSNYIISFIYGK